MQAVKAVKVLAGEADAVLSSKDESLVSKRMTPPEGGKRAYVSLAAHCAPATDSLGEPLEPWQCQQDRPFLNVRREPRFAAVHLLIAATTHMLWTTASPSLGSVCCALSHVAFHYESQCHR